jgi:Tat protein secretion system quality control protein TatD with DNase activity
VVHGFSAGANIGMAFKRLGFYLGIGPLLLRNNVRKLPEALSHLSPDSLVLETDAQGGNPESASQKRRIAMLASIVRRLAEIYSVTEEEMRRRLWRNTCNLLALKPDTKCK